MELQVVPYKKVNQDPRALEAMQGKTITKRLKVMRTSKDSDNKKVVLSTLEVAACGFPVGSKFINSADADAMVLRPCDDEAKQSNTVSSRKYKNRGDYVEPVIDIRHQGKIEKTIGDAEYVLVTISLNEIRIEADTEHQAEARDSEKAIVFGMGDKNKKGVYDGILKLLSLIKKNKFAQVKVKAEEDFKHSHEYNLLELQLRRLGYDISQADNGNLIASIAGAKTIKHIDNIEHTRPPHSEILKHRDRINAQFNALDPLRTFTVCSSGVDMMLLEQEGFNTTHLLEYRPHEGRDLVKATDPITGKVLKDKYNKGIPAKCELGGDHVLGGWDKSISGVIAAITNVKSLTTIFNQDIYQFKSQKHQPILANFQHIHCSAQCDDFASQKNKNERARALENLSSTADMFIEDLELIEDNAAPTAMIENVAPFSNSTECLLLETGLENLGYTVYKKVMYAPDFGGYTGRKRTYLFATTLPIEFNFPTPIVEPVNAWNDVIANNLHHFKKIKSEKTIANAIKVARDRFYHEGTAVFPTITKSNFRYTKDTTYFESESGYYIPDAELSKKLMGVDDFDLSTLGNEALAVEVIGQSVDASMHKKLTIKIKKHLLDYAQLLLNSKPTQLSFAI